MDFTAVAYVFNYDLPKNIDDYIHRIGRTGRCGKKGNAISFYTDNNKGILKDLIRVLNEVKANIPNWMLENSQQVYNDKIRKFNNSRRREVDFKSWGNKKKYNS